MGNCVEPSWEKSHGRELGVGWISSRAVHRVVVGGKEVEGKDGGEEKCRGGGGGVVRRVGGRLLARSRCLRKVEKGQRGVGGVLCVRISEPMVCWFCGVVLRCGVCVGCGGVPWSGKRERGLVVSLWG